MTDDGAEETARPLVVAGDADDRLRAVGDTVGVVVAIFLVASVLVVGVGDLLGAVGITDATNPVVVDAVESAMNFVGFLVVGLGYLAWREDWSLVGLHRPTLREGGLIVLGTVALAGTVQGLGFVVQQLGFEIAENVSVQAGQRNPTLLLVFIPMQFLFVAPAEELVFRGILQGLFRRAYGIVPGILVAAAVFGLFHYPALVGESGVWVVIGILAASGALLGALYEYTENIAVPLVVHGAWNAILYTVLYAQATGMV